MRLALGADRATVAWQMARDGTTPALAGVALGLGGAVLAGGAVERLLFGVSRFDPLTLAVVSLGLSAVALAASWIPSRRAAGISPADALRIE